MAADRVAAAAAIDAFLLALGRDPKAEPELRGTGDRVAAAFLDELCDGYDKDPAAIVASHKIASASSDLVVLRGAPVTTMCPHHLLPATGVATVGFAPRGAIVGLGALVELVDACARRLVLQEEIGAHVADVLHAALRPAWAGCRLVLEHGCVVHRAERRHGARVETFALRGELTAEERATAERALGLGT
jgi:GTP cyclohydrolase IA